MSKISLNYWKVRQREDKGKYCPTVPKLCTCNGKACKEDKEGY